MMLHWSHEDRRAGPVSYLSCRRAPLHRGRSSAARELHVDAANLLGIACSGARPPRAAARHRTRVRRTEAWAS